MSRRTVSQRIDEFIAVKPKSAKLLYSELDELWQIEDKFSVIKYAFYFGYLKGMRANQLQKTK